jgi:ribosomal protein L3
MNLLVEKIDIENKYVLIKGAVPGANNGYIEIKKCAKKKKIAVKK